jgi:hypothetical protein
MDRPTNAPRRAPARTAPAAAGVRAAPASAGASSRTSAAPASGAASSPAPAAPARAALAGLALAALALAAAAPAPRGVPAIVFVSRAPLEGRPGVIPGLGPAGRTAVSRGRLLLREPDGRVRALVPPDSMWDVADPAVSPDARRVAFAGVEHPDSAWRLWLVGIDGRGLRRLTAGDPARRGRLERLGADAADLERDDDFDPCWVDSGTLVFASTRWPQRSPYDGRPASNLFAIFPRPSDRSGPAVEIAVPFTAERNGAEEPAFDPRTGRVVFARWWFNHHRAPDGERAADGAPLDSANLWHAMEVLFDGTDVRPAAGDFRSRLGGMAYQPAVLADGSIVAVYAANTGLSPASGPTGIQRFTRRFAGHRRLAGAIVPETPEAPYGSPRGLAAPSACAPAGLPDGRIVFAHDPGGRGDFGLWVMRADGSRQEPLVDLPRTLELDPAPVVERRGAPTWRVPRGLPEPQSVPVGPLRMVHRESRDDPVRSGRDRTARRRPEWPRLNRPVVPYATESQIRHLATRFRYHDLDVFSPEGEAPSRTTGARLRFFAVLSDPAVPAGDTAVLVREADVPTSGEVDVADLPAFVPMFEDLVDSTGRVLRGPRGLAHVAGLNVGDSRTPSTCVGCHRGHSILVRDGRPRVRLPRR